MWSRANFAPVIYLSIADKDAPDLLAVLSSFQLKLASKKAGEATFQFRDDNGLLLDDSRLFPNTAWRFRFGFPDDLSPMLSMVVRNFEPKFADKRTLSVTLFDGTVTMAQNSSNKNWGTVATSTIARELAKKYNLKAEVEDTPDKPKKAVIQPGDMDDMQFLRDLAADIDFEVLTNGSILVLRRKPYDQDAAGVLTYALDPSERSYVKSFSPKVKSLGAVKSSGAAAAKTDKAKGDASKNATSKVQLDGETKKATEVAPGQGTATPAVGNTAGIAAAARSQMLDKVNEADSEHPLTPSLIRGKSYRWDGVGRQLGGKWYLHEVTHTINGTSSKTTCGWKRNDDKKAATTNSTKKDDTSDAKKPVRVDGETKKAVI